MFISFLYEIVATFLFLAFLPKIAYQAAFKGKYRASFFARLGFHFPHIKRKGRSPIVWIHAVSVGETQAVSQFKKELQAEIPDATFVVSSITETGHATARRVMPDAIHVFMPFDLFLPVKWVFSKCKPDLVILAEGDYWWRFLHEAKKNNARIVVVSGKMSERSCERYKTFPLFSRSLFSHVDFFCLQSSLYLERYKSLGIRDAQLKVLGNIKSDVEYKPLTSEEKQSLIKKCGFSVDDFIFVVGSTHSPEEELIIRELLPLLESDPHFKLMIVPRHPERFSEALDLVKKSGLSTSSWTALDTAHNPQIILVDAMGILMKCYQIASSAFVAGSLTKKVGGHNILEPIYFGIPTLTGPFMHTQQELLDTAFRFAAIIQVDEKTLAPTVQKLINDPALRTELRKNSLMMMDSLRGATQRTVQAIQTLVPAYFSSCNK